VSARSDQANGHVHAVAGVLTGDKNLESEGGADRHRGEAEQKVDHAADNVEEVIELSTDKVEEVAHKTNDALHRN